MARIEADDLATLNGMFRQRAISLRISRLNSPDVVVGCSPCNCCTTCLTSDFNGDGDSGTDADIEAFFRVLAGGAC